jgi:signal transduction histidine kinase
VGALRSRLARFGLLAAFVLSLISSLSSGYGADLRQPLLILMGGLWILGLLLPKTLWPLSLGLTGISGFYLTVWGHMSATLLVFAGLAGAWLPPSSWPIGLLGLMGLTGLLLPRGTLNEWISLLSGLGFAFGAGFAYSRLQEGYRAQAQTLRALEAAYRELQHLSAQSEELSRLQERERLARELHDTLGHTLTALTVQLEGARRLIRAKRHEEAATALGASQSLLRQTMGELREHLRDLRESTRWSEALSALAQDMARRNGWRLELELTPDELPPSLSYNLLRIAREALFNAERHAQARHLRVKVALEAEELILEVEDDGTGFNPAQIPPGHYGLQGIRERLALFGGHLELKSQPGSTLLRAAFPTRSIEHPSREDHRDPLIDR